MKQLQGFSGIVFSGAAVVMAIQPVVAAPATQVTAVHLKPTAGGVSVLLQTQPGTRPQVFAVNRSDRWTADLTGTQLRLPGGKSFSQDNPAPGISRITVNQLDNNSVRVTAIGQKGQLVGQVARPEAGGVVLNLSPSNGKLIASAVPATLPTVPSVPKVSVPAPATPVERSQPRLAQAPPAPAPAPGAPPPGAPSIVSPTPPLVPNPRITIQGGSPANPVALPALPRAVAPPTGDIAISQFNPATNSVDLGTAERVPRLVLRDAPAREVLALLARAAGLNLAYAPRSTIGQNPQQQQQQPQPGAAADEGPKVTLDIENELVQDVFNNILQMTGLEANRIGRTIIVGPRLPDDARNVTTRTLRLNQASATEAGNYLVTQGAELQLPITRVTIATLGTGANAQNTRIEEPDIKLIRAQRGEAPLPLYGVAVSVDSRLNSVVVSGTPRKVEIASALLSQLDARRRQVTVNVKIVDVNLTNFEAAGFSFSFGIGQNRFVNTGGLGIFNFGESLPGSSGASTSGVLGSGPINLNQPASISNFASNFFAQLQLQVTNGNAKILTDPTLVIQEGQRASVNLTQEVLTNVETEITGTGDNRTITVSTEKGNAGLTLNVDVDRIDDNGFITLAVNPIVSSIANTANIVIPLTNGEAGNQTIVLLQTRELQSGRIRLRDGQTLVAAGIIQDRDQVDISKIPILGDIPILGALFRRTNRTNQRQEVIIVLTPRILDDSDRATFGYNYTPGPGVRQILEQQPRR